MHNGLGKACNNWMKCIRLGGAHNDLGKACNDWVRRVITKARCIMTGQGA